MSRQLKRALKATECEPADLRREWFATTRWTTVLRASEDTAEHGAHALEELCRAYWFPLYGYLRRRGYPPEDAQDLTQGYFTSLLERRDLRTVRQEKGRFRSFLLAGLRHFVSDQAKRANRIKRGGGVRPLSLNFLAAEEGYEPEPSNELSPDKLFERRWALTVLNRVLEKLESEYRSAGKGPMFDRLRPILTGSEDRERYRDLACDLRTTEGAVKVAVHRMRKRFQTILREEIAHTVSDESQVDEELNDLIRALSNP